MDSYQLDTAGWTTAWTNDRIAGLYREKEATVTLTVTARYIAINGVRRDLVSMEGRENLFWNLTDKNGATYTWVKEHNVSSMVKWSGIRNVVLHNGKYYMKDWNGTHFSSGELPEKRSRSPSLLVLVAFGLLALLSGYLFSTISKTRAENVQSIPPVR